MSEDVPVSLLYCDALLSLLQHLPVDALVNAAAVCRSWRHAVDNQALWRDVCLGEGILYGRGEGASKFRPWLEKNHKDKLYWHLSRVDKGTRQDSKTEGAFAAYWNRPLNVAYLQTAAYGASDLLKDNLFVMLSSLEIVATMRGRAAYHHKFTAPLRFFSASNDLDGWSSLDMAQVGVARVRRASPARGV